MNNLSAKDIMHRDVVCVREDASLSECIDLICERHISGLPVIDAAGALVGIISQTDLLRREKEILHEREVRPLQDRGPGIEALLGRDLVRDVMSRQVVYASEDAPVDSLIDTMSARRIHRLVITSAGRIVGIVTAMDLAEVILRQREAAKRGAEFRRDYSHIYTNKHEKLVLRVEHIERMKTLIQLRDLQREHEGGKAISISDVVNACLDFVFEHPVDLRQLRDPAQLHALIAEEVCASVARDMRSHPPARVTQGEPLQWIYITRPAPPPACVPPPRNVGAAAAADSRLLDFLRPEWAG